MSGKVPTYKAPVFSFQDTAVRMPEKVDYSGLSAVADELLRRGAEENMELAEQQAIEDQANAKPGELVQRDVRFFGGDYDKAYNKMARLQFGIQKEQQIETELEALYQDNKNDIHSFDSFVSDPGFMDSLLEGVHIRDRGTFASVTNRLAGKYKSKITSNMDALQQTEQMVLFTEQANKNRTEMSLAMEATGQMDLQAQAKQEAFYRTLLDAGVSAATITSWKSADEMAIRQSKIIYQYELSTDKDQFVNALMTNEGPLKDLPVSERKSIATVLSGRIAERNAERTAKVTGLRERINDAIKLESKGKKSKETLHLLNMAKGIPELAPKLTDLASAMTNRQNLEVLSKVPTGQVQQQLNALRTEVEALGGHTDLTSNLEDGMLDIIEENQKAQDQGNLLGLAMERGLVAFAQAEPNGALQDPKFRVMEVERARSLFGPEVGYFTQAELDQFKTTYTEADVDGKLELIRNLSVSAPDSELEGVIAQIADKDPEVGYLVSVMSHKDPRISGQAIEILKGKEFLDLNPESIPKQAEVKRTIQNELTNYLPLDPSGKTTDMLSNAALALYVQDRRSSGRMSSDSGITSFAKTAVDKVLGISERVKINGQQVVPFEAFMKPSAVEKIWESLTEEDFKQMNNNAMPVDYLGTKQVSVPFETLKEGTPVYVSPGVYAIALPEADKTIPSGDNLIANDEQSDRRFFAINPVTKRQYLFKYNEHRQTLRKRVNEVTPTGRNRVN